MFHEFGSLVSSSQHYLPNFIGKHTKLIEAAYSEYNECVLFDVVDSFDGILFFVFLEDKVKVLLVPMGCHVGWACVSW